MLINNLVQSNPTHLFIYQIFIEYQFQGVMYTTSGQSISNFSLFFSDAYLHFLERVSVFSEGDLLDPRTEHRAAHLALHRPEFEFDIYSLLVL